MKLVKPASDPWLWKPNDSILDHFVIVQDLTLINLPVKEREYKK
jgi:hypothetical protein